MHRAALPATTMVGWFGVSLHSRMAPGELTSNPLPETLTTEPLLSPVLGVTVIAGEPEARAATVMPTVALSSKAPKAIESRAARLNRFIVKFPPGAARPLAIQEGPSSGPPPYSSAQDAPSSPPPAEIIGLNDCSR